MKGCIGPAVCALLIAIGPTQAQSPTAPRIQVLAYIPDQLVTLRAAAGFALVVELADDDRIETVVVGNSNAWQVTANKQGNRLFVKPLGDVAPTDMVVTTDARRYVFLLQGASSPDDAPFVVHFEYPEVAPVTASTIVPVARYRFQGDRSLFPIAMIDDGQRTTVTWKAGVLLPAIFALDEDGREAIVNGRMIGGDYVIEGVAPRFVFRRDKSKAVATRRLDTGSR